MNQAVYEIMLANNRAYIELDEINVKRAEIEPLVQSAANIMPAELISAINRAEISAWQMDLGLWTAKGHKVWTVYSPIKELELYIRSID